MPLECRLIEPAGWRARLIALWDGGPCKDGGKHHSARVVIDQVDDPQAECTVKGLLAEHEDDPRWTKMVCEQCGEPIPEEHKRAAGWKQFYNTESGDPERGDMFWVPCWMKLHGGECFHWDNCEGRHLYVVLPNGHHWDVDSRARNCTLKDDRTHRCWIRTGEPPKVTAGKKGHTCSAGAGSIAAGSYHGFLRNGVLT